MLELLAGPFDYLLSPTCGSLQSIVTLQSLLVIVKLFWWLDLPCRSGCSLRSLGITAGLYVSALASYIFPKILIMLELPLSQKYCWGGTSNGLFGFNPVLAICAVLLSCFPCKISFSFISARLIFNLRSSFLPPNLLNLSTGVPVVRDRLSENVNAKGT